MRDVEDVIRIVGQYEWLVARALEIVQFPMSLSFVQVDEPDLAIVEVDGETATLKWPEPYEYGMSLEFVQFPTQLLALDATEFDAWKAQQEADRKREAAENQRLAAERRAELAREAERKERRQYEDLKRKYEGGDQIPWFAGRENKK